MLLALLSGQRQQTKHSLSVSSLKLYDSKCVFNVDVLSKQSHKGKQLAPLEFLAFPQNDRLCVVSVQKECLHRMKGVRGKEDKLSLSYQKPHRYISKDTLASGWEMYWVQQVFTYNSLVHTALVQPARQQLYPVVYQWIFYCQLLGATLNQQSFTLFYKKDPTVKMGQAILDSYLCKH